MIKQAALVREWQTIIGHVACGGNFIKLGLCYVCTANRTAAQGDKAHQRQAKVVQADVQSKRHAEAHDRYKLSLC
eukprot:4675936-Amphidinium_carterae.1